MMLPRSYFEAMKARALAKLDGPDGLRALCAEAERENGANWVYVNAKIRTKRDDAESNLRIAEIMLRQRARDAG